MWKAFLDSHAARWLTPAALLLLTVLQYVLIIHLWPSWWAILLLGTLVQHRLGILCHELIHGLGFRTRKWNRAALILCDGALLTFGMLEVFRAQHLAHHRHVNTERDPAFRTALHRTTQSGWKRYARQLELVDQLIHTWNAIAGSSSLRVGRAAIALGFALSAANALLWILLGFGYVPLMLVTTSMLAAAGPSSIRGAIEHFGPKGAVASTNEYRPWIFNFHIERHIHHHTSPGIPWYRLEYLSKDPLPAWAPYYYWFEVHVSRRYQLLPPPRDRPRRATRDRKGSG